MGWPLISNPSESTINPNHLTMGTMSKRPNPASASAVFVTLLAATMAPPVAPGPQTQRVPVVEAQQLSTEKGSTPASAPVAAQNLSQMDDPKRRTIQQRRNAMRQVRRRMEKQGFALTGRQWTRLMRSARHFLRTGVVK